MVHGVWGNTPGETGILNTQLALCAPEMNITHHSAHKTKVYSLIFKVREENILQTENYSVQMCREEKM